MTESRAQWLHGLPIEDYLELDAIGSSGLELINRSLAHYRHATETGRDPTPAMRLGIAAHCAILEPDRFESEYTALEGCEGHLKDGRPCSFDAKMLKGGQGWCGRHDPGGDPDPVTVVDAADLEACRGMSRTCLAHHTAAPLLTGPGLTEESATFERQGVLCRIRPDRVTDAGIHASFKTTADASPEAFGKLAARLGYHRQLAFYRAGLRALGTEIHASVIIAVEQKPPHAVGCYLADEADLDRAEAEVDALLVRYADAVKRGEWPGYASMLQPLRLPPWTFPNEDDDE